MTSTPVIVRGLRQSLINDAMVCLHRVEQELKHPTVINGVSAGMGTGYHAGLAAGYLRRKEGETWATILPDVDLFVIEGIGALAMEIEKAGDGFNWVFEPGNTRTPRRVLNFEEASDMVETMVRAYFTGEHYWPEHYRVVDVEVKFELPFIDNWSRTGTIDLVVQDTTNGWVTVDDHKTSKKKWKKGKEAPYSSIQMAWYQQAAIELYETDRVTGAYSVMTVDGEFERRDAPRTLEQRRLAWTQGSMVARLIDQGGPFPPNPTSFLCTENWCDYWSTCAFGRGTHDDNPGGLFN